MSGDLIVGATGGGFIRDHHVADLLGSKDSHAFPAQLGAIPHAAAWGAM
jgi:hypothetical protein